MATLGDLRLTISSDAGVVLKQLQQVETASKKVRDAMDGKGASAPKSSVDMSDALMAEIKKRESSENEISELLSKHIKQRENLELEAIKSQKIFAKQAAEDIKVSIKEKMSADKAAHEAVKQEIREENEMRLSAIKMLSTAEKNSRSLNPQVPSSGAGGETSDGGGGMSNITGIVRAALIPRLLARAVSAAADIGAGAINAYNIGSVNAFQAGIEKSPIIGEVSKALRGLGESALGITDNRRQSAIGNEEQSLRQQILSLTRSEKEVRVSAATEAYNKAVEELRVREEAGEINEKERSRLQALHSEERDAVVRNAEFRESIQKRQYQAGTEQIRDSAENAFVAFQKGQLAGKIDAIERERSARERLLKIELDEDAVSNHGKNQEEIKDRIISLEKATDLQKTLALAENQRAVNFEKSRTSVMRTASRGIGSNTSETDLINVQNAERIAMLAAAATQAHLEDVDASTHQKALQADIAYQDAIKLETRRKLIEEERILLSLEMQEVSNNVIFLNGVRASSNAIAERNAILQGARHLNEMSAETRDQAQIESKRDENKIKQAEAEIALQQKLSEIKLKGGTHEDEFRKSALTEFERSKNAREEEVHQLELTAAAKKKVRQIELDEEKDFMNARNAIMAEANTGTVSHLKTHLEEIRENTREAVIRHPELQKELEEKGRQEEIAAVREGMHLKTVTAQQAHFTLFRGGGGVPSHMRTHPDNSIGGGAGWHQKHAKDPASVKKPTDDKMVALLSEIATNTKNATARAA